MIQEMKIGLAHKGREVVERQPVAGVMEFAIEPGTTVSEYVVAIGNRIKKHPLLVPESFPGGGTYILHPEVE